MAKLEGKALQAKIARDKAIAKAKAQKAQAEKAKSIARSKAIAKNVEKGKAQRAARQAAVNEKFATFAANGFTEADGKQVGISQAIVAHGTLTEDQKAEATRFAAENDQKAADYETKFVQNFEEKFEAEDVQKIKNRVVAADSALREKEEKQAKRQARYEARQENNRQAVSAVKTDQEAAKKALQTYAQVTSLNNKTKLGRLPDRKDNVSDYRKELALGDETTVAELKTALKGEALKNGVSEEAFSKFQEQVEPKAKLSKQAAKQDSGKEVAQER